MSQMKLYIGIEEDDKKETFYFEEGEDITRRQLERLVDGLKDSEDMRKDVLRIGVKATHMVRLADGKFYDVQRKTRTTFELQKH